MTAQPVFTINIILKIYINLIYLKTCKLEQYVCNIELCSYNNTQNKNFNSYSNNNGDP